MMLSIHIIMRLYKFGMLTKGDRMVLALPKSQKFHVCDWIFSLSLFPLFFICLWNPNTYCYKWAPWARRNKTPNIWAESVRWIRVHNTFINTNWMSPADVECYQKRLWFSGVWCSVLNHIEIVNVNPTIR